MRLPHGRVHISAPTLRLSPWLRRALSVSRISRVTDPRNLTLVGLPPKDLLVEVMAGWQATGYDGIECLRNACSVSKDFLYVPDPSLPILDRVQVRRKQEKLIKTSWRNLKEILNPQPSAQVVIHKLLDWIDRVDRASQIGAPRPAFETLDRRSIFPEDEEDKWWLTDVANRKTPAPPVQPDEDGPPSSEGEQVDDDDKSVEDEDPLTEEEVVEGGGTQDDDFDRRPAAFVPQAHWPRWEGDAS